VSGAENDTRGEERRRDVRVVAAGSALVHGRAFARGRLVDLSTGGASIDLAPSDAAPAIAEAIRLDVHLDRADSRWIALDGHVLRVAARRIAIVFSAAPVELGEVIANVIASAIEGAVTAHVLLVDPDPERRGVFAALLRRAGCRVAEASTPLEAIAHLGGSPIEAWLIALADTRPSSIADELRGFLGAEYPRLDVVSLGALSPTVAVVRLLAPR
jgi:hypothetical protein